MTPEATTVNPAAAELVAHHEQEAVDSQAMGFWLYLMSDLVIFAVLFATFIILSHSYAGGPSAGELFELSFVLVETMLLLFSSATCGIALLAMHVGNRQRVLVWLAITFLFGAGFIGMELHEFRALIAEGNGPQRSAFLSAFFTLVGTHGLHVGSGLVWMAVLITQVVVSGLTSPVRARLIRLSMFWHFLDIVWVGVFTIVYLLGVME